MYTIRKAEGNDAAALADVYNSNGRFLAAHLATDRVDSGFVRKELADMENAGFLSCVVEDDRGVVGLIDYKPGPQAYLSLFMLNARYQGRGVGGRVYAVFEDMAGQQSRSVRIDVVDGYAGNVVGFWEKQGFVRTGRTRLVWGDRQLDALTMVKEL